MQPETIQILSNREVQLKTTEYPISTSKYMRKYYEQKMQPTLNNTFVCLDKSQYFSKIVHLDGKGKQLNAAAFQGSLSYKLLSNNEVVIHNQELRYNGDYRDYINVWDLKLNKMASTIYKTCQNNEQDRVKLQYLLFEQSKLICVVEEHIFYKQMYTTFLWLAFYQYESGNQKLVLKHSLRYQIDKKDKRKYFISKLNNISSLLIVPQPTSKLTESNLQIEVEVLSYNIPNNNVSLIKSTLNAELLPKNISHISQYFCIISDSWEVLPSVYYLRFQLTKNRSCREQTCEFYDFIWDSKLDTLRKPNYLKPQGLYHIQFFNNFRQITKYQREALVSTYIVHQTDNSEDLIFKIKNIQQNNKDASVVKICKNNQIYVLEASKDMLIVHKAELGQLPYNGSELCVFLLTQIIPECDEELLESVLDLVQF